MRANLQVYILTITKISGHYLKPPINPIRTGGNHIRTDPSTQMYIPRLLTFSI